jgi:hypothetical protein
MPIFYEGISIGTRRVDFFVGDVVMVELKALVKLEEVHLAQAMNYCQAYNLPIGLLINFGTKSLEFKRVYNVNHPENKDYISGLKDNLSESGSNGQRFEVLEGVLIETKQGRFTNRPCRKIINNFQNCVMPGINF